MPACSPAELLSVIQRDYDIVSQNVCFGDLRFNIWRVADPDALLDDQALVEPHDELVWHPYWAQAWDAAHGIAWELSERELAGKLVLDLGCGLGITGTVAAARGADVVMADHAPPALLFAEINSWPWRERVSILQLDWRTDWLEQRFDLIVGADILYDRKDLPHLDAFWRRHLKGDGSLLLGDPNRAMTREFLDWLSDRGWNMSESARRVPQSDCQIRIVDMRPDRRG